MASEKISQLPSTSTSSGSDLYPLVSNSINYSITFTNLQAALAGAITPSQLPTITLTGNVTGSASGGTIPTTITNGAVINAMLANMGAHTVKANITNGSASPSDISAVSTATPSSFVVRDSSGDFSANSITSALIGNVTGASSLNVLKSGDTMTGNLSMGVTNTVTNLAEPTSPQDAATKYYVDNFPAVNGIENNGYLLSPVYGSTANTVTEGNDARLSTTNLLKVKQNPGAGEFSSIAAAMATITTSSAVNPFTVIVGPGIYVEPQIVMPPYVTLGGYNNATIVTPSNPSAHLIIGGTSSTLEYLTLTGVTGSGQAALYNSSYNLQVVNCNFANSTIGIISEGTTVQSTLIVNNCTFSGNTSTDVICRNSGQPTQAVFGSVAISSSGTTTFEAHGAGAAIAVGAAVTEGNGTNTCFNIYNGALLELASCSLQNYGTALLLANSGNPPTTGVESAIFVNNTQDIMIMHPSSTGTISATAAEAKSSFATPGNFALLLLDPDGKTISSGSVQTEQINGIFTDSTTISLGGAGMGVIEGGVITTVSGLIVNVSAGFGYLDTEGSSLTPGSILRLDWPSTNITLSATSTNYLYFDNTNTLNASPNFPDTEGNILVGRVVTNSTGIEFIDASPLIIHHYPNSNDNFIREALGPVFSYGCTVTEDSTPLHLDVTQGSYFFGNNNFLPSANSNITFQTFYQNGSGGWVIGSTNTVDTAHYDNGSGTLQSIPSGYYARHTLYLLGQGSNQKYMFVYAQTTYSSLALAEVGNIPLPPSYFKDGVVLIASIIVLQGSTSIVSGGGAIVDNRPRIGFSLPAVSSVGTVTSVGLSLPGSVFSITGSPVTSNGTLTGSLISQNINTVWAGPSSGSASSPSFRSLVVADLPTGIPYSNLTLTGDIVNSDISTSAAISLSKLANQANNTIVGNNSGISASPTALTAAQVTAMLNTFTSSLQGLAPSSGGGTSNYLRADGTWDVPPGTGVTSVAMTVPSFLSVSGSPVTSSGTLAVTLSGTALPVSSGGTGQTSLSQHYVLVGNGTSGITQILPTAGSGIALVSNGVSADPSFNAINIASSSAVAGTLNIVNGGTGVTSVTVSPTATSFAGWDVNSNLSANSFIKGYTTTTTVAGTTTLTVGSTEQQYFTGTTTQTVVLPVTSTLALGQSFTIVNDSTGTVTVQSSGGNIIQAMSANTQLVITVVSTSGTGTGSWNWTYNLQEPGTVTSVALSVPTFLSVSGSPVTSSGTLAVTYSGTALPVTNGGTGQTSALTQYGVVYASSTTAMASTAAGTANYPLVANSGSAPTFQQLSLTAGVTGTLPIGNGGTGQTSASSAFNALSPMTTLGDIIYGGTSGAGTRLAGNTTATREFLASTGSGSAATAPSWNTLVSGDIPNNAANTTGTAANITATSNATITTLSALTTASSLATIGTVTSGTWNATAVSAQYGGTGINTSSSTGVPTLSSGTWTISGTTGSLGNVVYSSAPAITGAWTLTDAGSIVNATTTSKVLAFNLSGMTASTKLTLSSSQSTSQTLTIPNIVASDTLATLGLAQTFSGANTFSASGTALTVTNTASIGTLSLTNALSIANGGTGTSTAPTQYGVMYASSATALASTAAGTSGYLLTSNATSAPTFQQINLGTSAAITGTLPIANGGTNATTVSGARTNLGIDAGESFITSGTTYTTPAGITSSTLFRFTIVAGGGGGAGVGGASGSKSAGGGAGGVGVLYITGLTASTGYTIAIGAAGSAGTATPGSGGNGGNTTLTIGATTYTSTGGTGATTGLNQNGGAGGGTTNMTIGVTGQNGGASGSGGVGGTVATSGMGGSSGFGMGLGGAAVQGSTAGLAGTGYGAGGGGASSTGSALAGGAGTAGCIVVEYWN